MVLNRIHNKRMRQSRPLHTYAMVDKVDMTEPTDRLNFGLREITKSQIKTMYVHWSLMNDHCITILLTVNHERITFQA